MRILKSLIDSLDFDLNEAIADYVTALEEHKLTIDTPAPVASHLVEAIVNAGGYEVEDDTPLPIEEPPVQPIRIYKSTMFRRMTDVEYSIYTVIRGSFPDRLGAVFDYAEYLSEDDEFWPSLYAAAVQGYGAERARELLAP